MTSETKSKWKPCKCGHELAAHAQPGQGRSRLPCERSGCECQDFTIEDNQAERVEVPELPSGVFQRDFPLTFSRGDIHCNLGGVLGESYDKWFVEVLNAVYLPGGIKERMEKAEARVRELEDAGWNDLEEQLKSGGKSPVVPT